VGRYFAALATHGQRRIISTMTALNCDHFPLLNADGAVQMAADESLLEHVALTSQPVLRFYTWDRPTLSLGYFQPFAERLAGLPVVRRQTGGGAIIHHHELTYALVLPASAAQKGVNWSCRMHEIIGIALTRYGVPAAALGCELERGRGEFLCFAHQTPGDLIVSGHKIVGSAQRRRVGGLLQHGSILLAASPHAPHLSGVRELTGTEINIDRLAAELASKFAQVTGWHLVPAQWTSELLDRREQIARDCYANPAWTERR
jgi:lipoate-protein ligase A